MSWAVLEPGTFGLLILHSTIELTRLLRMCGQIELINHKRVYFCCMPTCISIALSLVTQKFRSAISSFSISIKSRLYFKKGKNYQRKLAILIRPECPAGIVCHFNEIVTISTTGIWLDFFKRCHKRMRNAAFKGRLFTWLWKLEALMKGMKF